MTLTQLQCISIVPFISSIQDKDTQKVSIFKKNDTWYYNYIGEYSDFSSESICIYTILRKYHYYIDKYLPKYQMLKYGDFDIGVVFQLEDNKYSVFFGEKTNIIIDSDNLENAEDQFWTLVQQNKMYQTIIDDFEHINY